MQKNDENQARRNPAEIMLSKIIDKPDLQNLLQSCARILDSGVMKKIVEQVELTEGHFEAIPSPYKESISYLIDAYLEEEKNKLGMRRGENKNDIQQDPKLLLAFIKKLQLNLLKNEMTSIPDIIKKLKVMTDLSYCFLEIFPREEKSPIFAMINACIRFSQDEFDIIHSQKNLENSKQNENATQKPNVTSSPFLLGKSFFAKSINESKPHTDMQEPVVKENLSSTSKSSLITDHAGSVARCLVALYELGAFHEKTRDRNINFENVTQVANCLSAASSVQIAHTQRGQGKKLKRKGKKVEPAKGSSFKKMGLKK